MISLVAARRLGLGQARVGHFLGLDSPLCNSKHSEAAWLILGYRESCHAGARYEYPLGVTVIQQPSSLL